MKLPMREVAAKFTKSELIIQGWRSTELSHNMKSDSDKVSKSHKAKLLDATEGDSTDRKVRLTGDDEAELEEIGRKLGPDIVAKCENEKGELDLRRLTGAEAVRFMSITGVPLGRI